MPTASIHTEIDIDAPPAAVWAVLADGPAYPAWNPFVKSLEGELVEGKRISVNIQPPGKSVSTFTPVLLKVEPGKELRWRGSLPIPGLFVGEHIFVITPRGDGRSHLLHAENFHGLLVPLLGGMLKASEAGFKEMNAALKQRAEAAAGGG